MTTDTSPEDAQDQVLRLAHALPDAVRVPLDSLHADAEYLCARLLDKSLTREEVVTAIRFRIDAAKAALTTAAAVPAEGWVMVPVEPTEEMIIAGVDASLRVADAWLGGDDSKNPHVAMWFAMLASAPKAELAPTGHFPDAGKMVAQPAGEYPTLPLAITSAPERIWLDLGFNPYEEDAHFSNLHDLTWSKDNATGDGIEYVRVDLTSAPKAEPVPAGEYPPLPEPLEINWPELHSHALGCGVEDRGLRDRYECAEYGWQDGVDKAVECVPDELYDADQMRAYVDADRAMREQADSQPALPKITAEDRSFLHYNPNTDDIVKWVQHYASAAITADRAMRAQAAPTPSEWDVRGRLAASLTCWHRLTGQEAAELVALFQGHPAQAAPAAVAHIQQPYSLAEIKAKIASNDYSAELMLQHAMLLLEKPAAPAAQGDAEDAARYDWLFGPRADTQVTSEAATVFKPLPQDEVISHLQGFYMSKSEVNALIDAARSQAKEGA